VWDRVRAAERMCAIGKEKECAKQRAGKNSECV